MNEESTITERGQITLPKDIRDRYAFRPGTKVRFEVTAQGIMLTKVSAATEAVHKVFGVLKGKENTDHYITSIRGKVE